MGACSRRVVAASAHTARDVCAHKAVVAAHPALGRRRCQTRDKILRVGDICCLTRRLVERRTRLVVEVLPRDCLVCACPARPLVSSAARAAHLSWEQCTEILVFACCTGILPRGEQRAVSQSCVGENLRVREQRAERQRAQATCTSRKAVPDKHNHFDAGLRIRSQSDH